MDLRDGSERRTEEDAGGEEKRGEKTPSYSENPLSRNTWSFVLAECALAMFYCRWSVFLMGILKEREIYIGLIA